MSAANGSVLCGRSFFGESEQKAQAHSGGCRGDAVSVRDIRLPCSVPGAEDHQAHPGKRYACRGGNEPEFVPGRCGDERSPDRCVDGAVSGARRISRKETLPALHQSGCLRCGWAGCGPSIRQRRRGEGLACVLCGQPNLFGQREKGIRFSGRKGSLSGNRGNSSVSQHLYGGYRHCN